MTGKKKILIVDDEEDMRSWLATFFEDSGYETIVAVDGVEGMEKAKNEGADLITLDISMDNQSGVKMLRRLQETPETSAIPVVIVTGVSTDLKRFIDRAKQVKMPDGFFEKPVDRDALLSKVRELVGG